MAHGVKSCLQWTAHKLEVAANMVNSSQLNDNS